MEISFSKSFKKSFLKRVKGRSSETIFWDKVASFAIDPYDSQLRTHKLSGKLDGLWSFSVEYDLRVVFYFTKEKPPKAIFVDIGTHDEVY